MYTVGHDIHNLLESLYEAAVNKLNTTVAITLLFFIPLSVQAQQVDSVSTEHDSGWFSAGIGFVDIPLDLGVGVTAYFGRKYTWQVGFQRSTDFTISGTATHVNSINVGQGMTIANRWGRLAVAVGPAIVWGLDRFDHERDEWDSYTSIGLTLNGQVMFTPIRELGAGLELYCNVNPVLSVAGVRVIFVLEGNK
ncbi:MAG: hypothetical protein ACLFQM_02530 [Fidelibacterota bacterium]